MRVYQFRHSGVSGFRTGGANIHADRSGSDERITPEPCYLVTMPAANGKVFRRMHDGSPVDLLAWSREILAQGIEVEVLVGSDSQNRTLHTVYTTAVVIRYRHNGAQVAYHRERAPKVTDLWTRLWGEVERSLAVAQWLREEGRVPVRKIDMDLNSDAAHGSHRLHAAAVGYIRAHGYEPLTKPEMLVASWAADVLCNGWGPKHEAPIHRMADRGDVTLQIDL